MLPVRSAICLLMLLTSFSHCKSRKQEAKLTDAGIQGEEACLFGDQTQPSYGSSGASSIDLLSWKIISSLAAASDANFDSKVDGTDLSMLLGNWGDAPRDQIPISDCPLNLINP